MPMKDNTSTKKISADDFPWHKWNQECVRNLGNWDQQRDEGKKSPLQRTIQCLKDSLQCGQWSDLCFDIFPTRSEKVGKWYFPIMKWDEWRKQTLKDFIFLLNFIESLLSCIKWIEIYLPILVPTVVMHLKNLSRCMLHSLSTVVSSLPSLTPNIFTKWYPRLNQICLYNRSKHYVSLIFRRNTLIP